MRSVKGIIIGFLLILLGFAAAQYSLIAAGVLAAGGLAAVIVSALPKRAEAQPPQAALSAPQYEFVCRRRANYARSRLQKLVGKARQGFFDSLVYRLYSFL